MKFIIEAWKINDIENLYYLLDEKEIEYESVYENGSDCWILHINPEDDETIRNLFFEYAI